MINDGCDVICVNLVDRTEPATIIDMAEKSDTPVIFFNRELVEGDLGRWDRLYYVGAKTFYNDKGGQAKGMLDLACQLCISKDTGSLTLEKGKYIRLPYAKVEPGVADSFLHHESSDNK